MSTVTLYIVRHGECSGNVAQKFIEPMTDVLTPVGQAQAGLLGKHLKDVPFTRAFASDYPRAVETAQAVLQASSSLDLDKPTNVQLKIDTRLRERDYTAIIGVGAKEALSYLYTALKSGTAYRAVEWKNCESVQDFEGRIISFFKELFDDLRNNKGGTQAETILIVSHGLTIQRLMMLLNTEPESLEVSQWTESRLSERQMRNTSYHKLVFEVPTNTGQDLVGGISGRVELAHCRDHVDKGPSVAPTPTPSSKKEEVNVKDTGNYTFLQQQEYSTLSSSFKEETVHYCTPV